MACIQYTVQKRAVYILLYLLAPVCLHRPSAMHKGEVLLAHGVYIYITFYLSRIPYIVHWVVFWGGGGGGRVRGIPMYRFIPGEIIV